MNRDVYPEITVPSSVTLETDAGDTVATLNPDSISALTAIAIRNGIGYVMAIEQAVNNEITLLDIEDAGGKLVLLQRNGKMRKIERSL